MTDAAPWVAQVFERDHKFERFQAVLEAIASRERDLAALTPKEALPMLREVTRAARAALEK
jgi:hypothetical protein